jgi:hypothetical protein
MIKMQEKIVTFIDSHLPINMPADKKAHLVCGFLISLITCIVTGNYVTATVVGLIAAIGKEIKDQIVYGGFDFNDIGYTMMGVLIPVLFMILVDIIL